MNSTLLRSLVLGACLSASGICFGADVSETLSSSPSDRALPASIVPDRYIVEVVAGADPQGVAASHGVSARFVYRHAVQGFAGTIPPGRIAALKADFRVRSVTPDRVVFAIGKPSGGGAPLPSQVVPQGVKRIGASPAPEGFTGAGVGVAVVDTGVDLLQADLVGVRNSFSSFGGSAQDNNGHGTHVAGIVAAANNGRDVVGVAPGATIYAVKVLDASGSGSDSDVIAGLDWVKQNATSVSPSIRVVNMSLGRTGTVNDNPAMRDAIAALSSANIAVVVAAGNDAKLEISQQVPSAYPSVLAIASTTAIAGTNALRTFPGVIGADTASYFTSDGPGVTVSAPGADEEDIGRNGFITSVGILSLKLGGGTTRMSGTSMAAPHAAGVAALTIQKYPGIDVTKLRNRLESSSSRNDIAPLDSPTSSYSFDGIREGVLNASGALSLAPGPLF